MEIDKEAIEKATAGLAGEVEADPEYGVMALHIRELKEGLAPLIKKYSVGVKNLGEIEEKVLDIAIDYLVEKGAGEAFLGEHAGYFSPV